MLGDKRVAVQIPNAVLRKVKLVRERVLAATASQTKWGGGVVGMITDLSKTTATSCENQSKKKNQTEAPSPRNMTYQVVPAVHLARLQRGANVDFKVVAAGARRHVLEVQHQVHHPHRRPLVGLGAANAGGGGSA